MPDEASRLEQALPTQILGTKPKRLERQRGKLSVTIAVVVALASLGLIVYIGSSRRAATTPPGPQSAPVSAPPVPAPTVQAPPEPVRLEPRFLPAAERPAPPEPSLKSTLQQSPPQFASPLRLSIPSAALSAVGEGWRQRWRREANAQLTFTSNRPDPGLLERLSPFLEPSKEDFLITLGLLLRALP